MSQLPDKAQNDMGKQPAESKATVSLGDYQQLLLAYQSIRQERDMLSQVLRAFRLNQSHRQFPSLKHKD